MSRFRASARRSGYCLWATRSRALRVGLAIGETNCISWRTRSVLHSYMREQALTTIARDARRAHVQNYATAVARLDLPKNLTKLHDLIPFSSWTVRLPSIIS